MNFVKFASASEDIKIWESENCILSDVISTHDQPISSVNWSPDDFLASCPKNGGPIVMSYFKPRLVASFELPQGQQTYARFSNSTSRYVTSCGVDSDVLIWDVRERRIKKSLKSNIQSRLNCVLFNETDTHVACGGQDGSVAFINTTSNVVHAPLFAANVKSVLAMEFSHTYKTLLGTSSDDGSCCLWDCHGWKLLHCFLRSHSAPATGIAFSPVNEMFMATVGLDCNIVSYDSRVKKILNAKSTESPLTAIDFTAEGRHMVIGNNSGVIAIYDLRSFACPVKSFVAHSSAISALRILKACVKSKFDQCIKSALNKVSKTGSSSNNLNKEKTATMKSSNQIMQTPMAPTSNARIEVASVNRTKSELKMVAIDDVVSPPGSKTDSISCDENPLKYSPVVFARNTPTKSVPLKEILPSIEKPINYARIGSSTNSTQKTYSQQTPRKQVPDKAACSLRLAPSPSPIVNSKVVGDASLPSHELHQKPDDAELHSHQPTAVQNFPLELLQSTVSDIVEKFSDKAHSDVVNLQVQMVKLFHRLQDKIDKVSETQAINEELIKEICRLREENKKLRFRF